MSKINDLKKHIVGCINNSNLVDLILNFFHKEFKEQDYLHTLRQERWKFGVHCPFCQSANIQKQQNSTEFHAQYLCLDCNEVFDDQTGTPLAGSSIPLQTWIHCWYLSQYCHSPQYIADKLNIDINILINMLHGMQNIFASDTVTAKLKNLPNSINTKLYDNKKRNEAESKKNLFSQGDTSKQPTDTREYRRQKNKNKNINKPDF